MAAAAIIGAVLNALANGANKKDNQNQQVQQYNFGQAAQGTPMQQNTPVQTQPMPTEQTPTGGQ